MFRSKDKVLSPVRAWDLIIMHKPGTGPDAIESTKVY